MARVRVVTSHRGLSGVGEHDGRAPGECILLPATSAARAHAVSIISPIETEGEAGEAARADAKPLETGGFFPTQISSFLPASVLE